MPEARAEAVAALDEATAADVRDLILALADSKRLLGMRYAEWILGAPELEAGIACASMAQDEWGHARQVYALLRDLGEDVDRLEHGRGPQEYRSMEVLDRAPAAWADLVALNLLADGALAEQFRAQRSSSYEPLRQRCAKLLEEERFHAAHAAAWVRRFAHGGDDARAELGRSVEAVLPRVLAWFGPADAAQERLRAARVVDATPEELRSRFRARVEPLLAEVGLERVARQAEPDFSDWDAARRRSGAAAPDEATIERIRGDKNRTFLMD